MGKADHKSRSRLNAIVGIPLAVLGVVAGVAVVGSTWWSLRSNGAYRQGLEIVRGDAAVQAVFGTPITDGLFVKGRIRGYADGSKVASLTAPIAGPRRQGVLHVLGDRPGDGPWRVTSMTIEVEGKRVLHWDPLRENTGFHR